MTSQLFDRITLVGAAGAALLGLFLSADALAAPTAERAATLVHLVRQDCGSCHGMRLSGGLGPALTPAALADRPREAMIATMLHGRPGTAMPPWSPFITEAEANWIMDQLLSGFPEELARAR